MKYILTIILIGLTINMNTKASFKDDQKKYPRVREAYQETESNIVELLSEKDLQIDKLQIYIRAFKNDKKIELWGKNINDEKYQLIKTYKICRLSGSVGPKRKQGDLQVPEGFYHINIFNPYSKFHLSLGINYPNKSDRILGVKDNLGGDIFIHGSCVTIGCLPITDKWIKEMYVFCVEAKNNGQENIPVTIFPSELLDLKYAELSKKYASENDIVNLWNSLKKAFDLFNTNKTLPEIVFHDTGKHTIKP